MNIVAQIVSASTRFERIKYLHAARFKKIQNKVGVDFNDARNN